MKWFLLGPWKQEGHFTKSEYPSKFIDKQVKKYLSKKIIRWKEPSKTKESNQYFKLPLIRKTSKFTDSKLQTLTMKFFEEEINSKIIFNTFKLASPLWTKDKVLCNL